MESIFCLGEDERAAFLRHMLQSFGSSYICLWSYSPLPSNCLLFLDGFYDEERLQQPSSSTGTSSTLARTLFTAYCGSVNFIDYGFVPGFAFKNNVPYLEMKVDYLQTMVAAEMQIQFYQEAGIKTAVFMGCPMGEIELGFSTDPQVNLQMEIQRWFPGDFWKESSAATAAAAAPPHHQHYPAASSSSNYSLRLESEAMVGDGEAAPLILQNSMPNTTNYITPRNLQRNELLQIEGSRRDSQMHHMIAERRRREKISDSIQILKSLLPHVSKKDKASVLSNTVEYLRSLRSQTGDLKRRNVEIEMQIREIRDEDEDEDDDHRLGVVAAAPASSSSDQRVNVEIANVAADSSTSTLIFDLRVCLRSKECSLSDLLARVLGFFKHTNIVNTNLRSFQLLSLQSNTTILESTPLHALLLTLKLLHQGDEFDEAGFQEAVRRVVDDLPH